MSSVPEPPRGFRGVFLWVPTPSQFAAGSRIAADDLPDALAAFLDVAQSTDPPSGPVSEPEAVTSHPPRVSKPYAGIIVLGRWLGAKPGDGAWGVQAVERVDGGFEVSLDDGRLVVRVAGASEGILMKGAPYGELLAIPQARDAVVTSAGEAPGWLPSVRDGHAYDMRGNRAPAWPSRRAYTDRSPFATKHPVPALMLSVWRARPIPQALFVD